MLAALLTRPVTIIHRTAGAGAGADEYGNPIPAETTVQTVCELQQTERAAVNEPAGRGELSDTHWLLILPAGTQIDTSDAIIADSRRFELIGDPWPVRNPRTGSESHVQATVRRTAGADDQ